MPKPKLLTRKGKPVPEWMVTPQQLRALARLTPKVTTKQRIKQLPPIVPKKQWMIFPETIPIRDLIKPHLIFCTIYCPPRYRVRKNQKDLTPLEWARFIHAIEALAEPAIPSPTYADFVEIHRQAMDTSTGMMWGAHGDARFLPWHREYLAKLEARLITINPLVTIPYWNWIEDRAIPPQLSDPSDLVAWGVTRGSTFNSALLATAAQQASLMAIPDYATFRMTLEVAPFHNRVHNLVGGTMATSASPADPLFWLHHGFVDKLWADWQTLHPGASTAPLNLSEVLQPAPIMTRTVGDVMSIRALGYVYA